MQTQLLLLALLLATGPLSAQYVPFFPEAFIVTAQALNLREAPDLSSRKITTLSRGNIVTFVEAHNNGEYVQADTSAPYAPWFKVRYKDKTGYAFGAYLEGTYQLLYEDDIIESIPPLNWYGVFTRDTFSDEIRKVSPKILEEYSEMYGTKVKVLKTDQKEQSKFLIGTTATLKTGYVGPLGSYKIGDFYMADGLFPGSQLSIYPGQEPNDTSFKAAYQLAAIGCAKFENDFVQIRDYHLYLVDYGPQPAARQDLTPWVTPEYPDQSPSVSLLWYGDLDMDNKPDAIIQDCPFEAGCRASLFLSSVAPKGSYLKKVCEHFWPGE